MKQRKLSPGDVFAIDLPDGRKGAIRLVKIMGKSKLIAVTPYINQRIPSSDSPILSETLVKTWANWNSEKEYCVYDGKLPDSAEFITNANLSDEEKAFEVWCGPGGFPYGGKFNDDSIAFPVYYQWRWDYERDEFEKEINKPKTPIEYIPKETMNDQQFWELIAELNWNADDDGIVLPLIDSLTNLTEADIFKFEETLTYKLYQLDTFYHAKNFDLSMSNRDDYISVDGFLYARCAVIAKGKNYFNSVLRSASKMPNDLDFESLLTVSSQAYENKTGEEFEYGTGLSYETYSNEAKWK